VKNKQTWKVEKSTKETEYKEMNKKQGQQIIQKQIKTTRKNKAKAGL
jgi:hypothetical protein